MRTERPLIPRLTYSRRSAFRLTPTQQLAADAFLRDTQAGGYTLAPLPCLCGAADDLLIAERERHGLPLTTVLCRACGLLRSDPYLTDASLRAFYERTYRSLYGGDTSPAALFEQQRRSGEWILNWVVEKLGGVPAAVIEVGCGAGGILSAFADAGARVAGCDFDDAFLAYGRARGLDLRTGDASAVRGDAPAELVVLSHVLEHLRDPISELGRIRALLRPGGAVYVEVPGVLAVARTYGDPALFLQNAHAWHFTAQTLAGVMACAGFEQIATSENVNALYRVSHAGRCPESCPSLPDRIVRSLLEAERRRHVNAARVALRRLRVAVRHRLRAALVEA